MQLENMSVAKIKEFLDDQRIDTHSLIKLLRNDGRKAVQQLSMKLERKLKQAGQEEERLRKLWNYENAVMSQGYRLIAGVDEAGRGPLAGPVVAAAVIFPPGLNILKLDDSKKLTVAQRENLYKEILDKAIAYGVGIADVEYIECNNILKATYFAMKEALGRLDPLADYALVDGYAIPELSINQQGIIKGDSLSASIAAASIVAKVTRDRIMLEMDKKFPQYGFASHKGYGTKEHIEKIKQYGRCVEHRASFLRSII